MTRDAPLRLDMPIAPGTTAYARSKAEAGPQRQAAAHPDPRLHGPGKDHPEAQRAAGEAKDAGVDVECEPAVMNGACDRAEE